MSIDVASIYLLVALQQPVGPAGVDMGLASPARQPQVPTNIPEAAPASPPVEPAESTAEKPAAAVEGPAPPGEASAPESTRVPRRSYEQRTRESPYRRLGAMLGGNLGTRFCLQSLCDPVGEDGLGGGVGIGAAARLQFEYRFIPYIALAVHANLAFHRVNRLGAGNDDPTLTVKERLLGYGALIGVTAYPLPFSRVDPYVGLGFGVQQDRERTSETSPMGLLRTQTWKTRPMMRLSFGIDFFVTKKFSLGPRIDLDRMFLGRVCSEATSVQKACEAVQRSEKDSEPRWITFGIDLKGHF
jgi:hypothetical protein